MIGEFVHSTRRVLDPIDRISEVLFGLIMVLTFTGSLGIADAGRDDVRAMLIGALGCNLAWGIIDGVFYLMGSLADKGREISLLRQAAPSAHPQEALDHIKDALPRVVASVLSPEELRTMQQRLGEIPLPSAPARLGKEDWLGACGVFLLVFLSTFPVAIPFLFMGSVGAALRASNAIAIAMLFLSGFAFGRLSGRNPVLTGAAMVVLGGILVAATIALGG